MIGHAERTGASVIKRDRIWHYTEGMINWNPNWLNHGIRIIPGPSTFRIDVKGDRLPAPYTPGADTNGTMQHILSTGESYSWFVLDHTILKKEYVFSGSKQNPDLNGKQLSQLVSLITTDIPAPIAKFLQNGVDWVTGNSVGELVDKLNDLAASDTNRITPAPVIDADQLEAQLKARDSQTDNSYSKDYQINAETVARKFIGDKLIRVSSPHKILDPKHGPLIVIRLHILTRKTLGG